MYEFPEDPQRLWKVVRTIRRLDNFRNRVIQSIRWDVFNDQIFDKRRTIYVHNQSANSNGE